MRKTPREILDGPGVTAEIRHEWLATATAQELFEFLRWVKQDSSWASHGRDALNVVLSKENINLQKDVRDLTKKLHRLTFFLALIGLIQIYPVCKDVYPSIKSFFNSPKAESTPNKPTDANQMENKNNNLLNHKK